ncbi:hypothetical protein ABEG72_23170 [Pantoea agglomerans]|uniref:hypothetical protein n=1 Tax=Enterobacter agglomerans TaxID=549 RepID=UPI001042F93C|nr:hypothetical protein [Pantoea agglomerans]TCZ21617.1 hypothetical protein EYB39_23795 [Pantoea agglomerans]
MQRDGKLAINPKKDDDTSESDNKWIRIASSSLFVVALQLYIAICSYLFVDSLHLESLAAIITAFALTVSLITRAFVKTKNGLTNFMRSIGDWVAVIFTLSTLMKPLANLPWVIVWSSVILVIAYAVSYFKEE